MVPWRYNLPQAPRFVEGLRKLSKPNFKSDERTIVTFKIPAGGPGGETEGQYLSSRQYSALNKDFQMDDVFVDPKLFTGVDI
jgi:hypothetical protein